VAYHNTFARFVAIKEEQAHLAKSELLVLWTDYFKPNHLPDHPNLDDTFWKAAKLCSACKVEVSLEQETAERPLIGMSNLGVLTRGALEAVDYIREKADESYADILVIGRDTQSGPLKGLREHAMAIIREAPCPVISV